MALQTNNTLEVWQLAPPLQSYGIEHMFMCPYSHQQMGTVVKRHGHLIDTVITILEHTSILSEYWDFIVVASTFKYNCNPSRNLDDNSPLEKLFGIPPDYSVLWVFGSKCFPYLWEYRQGRLNRKSLPCIFLGYPTNYARYIYYDPIKHRSYVSQNVWFIEGDFSLNKLLESNDKSGSNRVSKVSHPLVVESSDTNIETGNWFPCLKLWFDRVAQS